MSGRVIGCPECAWGRVAGCWRCGSRARSGASAEQRGTAALATIWLSLLLAALLLLSGPLLDDAADAELQAATVVDAQQQAQHTADYQRWVRRLCRNDDAAWMQLEHGVLVCYDGAARRLDAAVIASQGATQ